MASFRFAGMSSLIIMGMMMLCTADLSSNFYDDTCPQLSTLVQQNLQTLETPDWAPAVLRLFFHDCMVQGCDASILITQRPNEKEPVESEAADNSGLRGFDVIKQLKDAVEEECPQIVSCADILALAAEVAVSMTHGPSWDVEFGRRDGRTSQAALVANHIPSASSNVSQLMEFFNPLGLSKQDLVVLSGAHTIGIAHCNEVTSRLYNFSNEDSVDPSMEVEFAKLLQNQCPFGGDNEGSLPLDLLTSSTFDNTYYHLLQQGKGLFSSDEALALDPSTQSLVNKLASSQMDFFTMFVDSITRFGRVGVLEGSHGEIRNQCDRINT